MIKIFVFSLIISSVFSHRIMVAESEPIETGMQIDEGVASTGMEETDQAILIGMPIEQIQTISRPMTRDELIRQMIFERQQQMTRRPITSAGYGMIEPIAIRRIEPVRQQYSAIRPASAPAAPTSSYGQRAAPVPVATTPSYGRRPAPVPVATTPSYGRRAAPVPVATTPSYGRRPAPVPVATTPAYGQRPAPVPVATTPRYGQRAAPVPVATTPFYRSIRVEPIQSVSAQLY
jgi:hypothetical protein